MAYCIGLIVADPEEAQQIQENVFPQEIKNGKLLVRAVRPWEVLATARALARDGAQAIIARGGNYQTLRDVFTDVPLVELTVTAQDVFAILNDVVRNYSEIWLVLSSYVHFDFEGCRRLFPSKVHCFRYGPVEDMLRFLASVDAPADTLVVGGGFVVEPAQARGFDAIQVRSSPDSLRNCCETAQRILQVRDHEAARAKQIATILSNIEDGVVFSKDGDCVWQCLNCGHIVIGKKAPELCPVCKHPQSYFQVKPENY